MNSFAKVLIASVITIFFVYAAAASSDDEYARTISKWRADYETDLKSDTGWLTLAGLFWLKEGINNFGTDPANEIVLPKNSSPPRAGAIIFSNGKALLQVGSDVALTVNGKRAVSGEIKSDDKRIPDVIAIGHVSFTIIKRGERFGVRVRDTNNPNRVAFKGARWFSIDEQYRVKARFVRYEKPRQIEIANVLGDVLKWDSPGYVLFTLRGRELRLEPVLEGEKSFFIFADETNGKTSYPAGRFLYADKPDSDSLILDFNQATNPPCAFTKFATCPLPPRQNRLRVAIEAGELNYHSGARGGM